ncbi:MAG TPA: hydantoinase/oxoprolinase family protein [Streptosporangiales bacterium]
MAPRLDLRLGVDVGGTNTDAVVLDRSDTLVAKAKVPTTPDVTSGIERAIEVVVARANVPTSRVTHVMIGTTHATNAVLERRGLCRVAVVRIGGPATHAVRPLFGWPEDLRSEVSAGETIVSGGSELDGEELAPFDGEALARFLGTLPDDVNGIAVTSVFSPVSADHELAAEEIIKRERGGGVHVSLSHEIGSIGLLERENAAVLNEALVTTAHGVAEATRRALADNGLDEAIVFFAQNDGTLMTLDYAVDFPVLTIGSGPANSIRGAAYLSGLRDALVADVGGTSTDVGVLVNGFPRESTLGVRIGGIDTNFRMPDLVSIALGGGTTIMDRDGTTAVGPGSVGYRLREDAVVFGGTVPTLTDAAVLAGRADIGHRGIPAHLHTMLADALRIADERVTDAVDRIKLARGSLPLVVVGGGSVLVPDELEGVTEVVRPDNHDVANAIGAAIGSVSGQTDRVYSLGGRTRAEVLEDAKETARDQAVRAGADPTAVELVDLEEIPLSYLTDPAVRIRAKAAGPLGTS